VFFTDCCFRVAGVRDHPGSSPLDAPKVYFFGDHVVRECTVFLYIFATGAVIAGAVIAIKPVRKV
jgi:hypothetical protein